MQCKKCKQFLSNTKDDLIKCKGCESFFHKKCVRNQKLFMESEMCEPCQKSGSPKINTPSKDTTAESVLSEVNKKLDVMYKMEKKLDDLKDAVEFYAEQCQEMIEFKKESEKKMKALEQKNVYLEKYSKALEERMQDLEQKNKDKNIEIHGVEYQPTENTERIVKSLASKINMNPDDVLEVERVGREKENESNKKPKIILVTLRSKQARNQWLQARKQFKLTNDTIYSNNSAMPIFINEDIPKYKRQLLWLAKEKLKGGYKYIWVQNSNILVKKSSEEKKIFKIRSEQDIDRLAYNQ